LAPGSTIFPSQFNQAESIQNFSVQDSELSDQMLLRSAARVGAWVLCDGAHAGAVVLADSIR